MSAVNAVALLAAAGGDYQISRSVRLRSSASAFFNRTPSSAGNRKTWTWSGWVKLGALTSGFSFLTQYTDGNNQSQARIQASGVLRFYDLVGGSFTTDITWSPVYRDPSAWYHLMLVADTTQATNTNRIKFYVNGVQVTSTSSASWPTQNTDLRVNLNGAHFIGQNGAGGELADGYLTEVNFIDGQALTPSSFGENDAVTGVWKPKKYAGTYGTNGFYLNFSDNSNNTATTIGKDYSGNNNNWTPNNISVTSGVTYDSMLDVPTQWADGGNGRGNYAVVNPLPPSSSGGSWFTQDGNLRLIRNGGGWTTSIATVGVTSGKWYWEVTPQNAGNQFTIGVAKDGYDWTTYLGSNAFGWSYIGGTGDKYTGGVNTAYGATYTTNDVIGVAFDADAGTLTFYKNGTSQGQAYSGLTSGPYYPACGVSNLNTAAVFNFGQRPFAYTPPTGFKALNTQNLPAPTILKGNQFFDVSLYTGTGGTRTISGLSFQPDMVWNKSRSLAYINTVMDSVRGVGNSGASKALVTNNTEAESWSSANFGYLSSFNSDGVTYTAGSTSNDQYNQNSATYVQWSWKESATAGFDIVTTTMNASGSTTINHSLGVTPSFVITKNRNGTVAWNVYSTVLGTNQYLQLNATIAATTLSGFWGSPTSTQFTFGSPFANTGTYVAYLFAEVAGFSRFGSYTGNGSTDGPFVFCGFRPRFIMVKRTDAAGANWSIYDTARDVSNVAQLELYPNASTAETTSANARDFLSNGFKLRTTDTWQNASGGTYIFAAFAEFPFRNALAR